MTFTNITGAQERLDETLCALLKSGVFQLEQAAQLSEYSVGQPAYAGNPITPLLSKADETARLLHLSVETDADQAPDWPALAALLEGAEAQLEQMRTQVQQARAASLRAGDELSAQLQPAFTSLVTAIRLAHETAELRRKAVLLHGSFHLVGYLPTDRLARFEERIGAIGDVALESEPAGRDMRIPPPVRLKNNLFTRPFEQFVTMYGTPRYGDIDPTPFVALTYTLLFGVMFGDLGHGLCVFLLGLFLDHARRVPLGSVMSRIGLSSMVFGFFYGSVFGFEHLLDPIFINLFGLPGKPIEVLEPGTTNRILLSVVALGAMLLVISMLFNILTGLKRRDYELAALSPNGLCGLLLYTSVLVGGGLLFTGRNVFTTPYVLAFIALPLLLLFIREPLTHLIRAMTKDADIQHDEDFTTTLLGDQAGADLKALFSSPFLHTRFGRIPKDSYEKLNYYTDGPFLLFPIKTDPEYIWLLYATADLDKAETDAIFKDLYFERVFLPEETLQSVDRVESFIRSCIETGAPAVAPDTEREPNLRRARSLGRRLFPDGVGSFFSETFFELFEVLLSLVTNTMSFLRVGGFMLVHAGMMSVVFTLNEMVGGAGLKSVLILLIGNCFVMALEGLIVGIQALRLEFYEMFSRFFEADGVVYTPATLP